MFALRFLGVGDQATYPVAEGVTCVGRGEDCGVQIRDPRTSRHHAELTVDGAAVTVRDLGSRNGLFVNGQRVTNATLHPGDEVGFASARFALVELPGQTAPALSVASLPTQIIERGRLAESALPEDTRRLQVLYAIAESLASNLQLPEVLSRVLDTLYQLFAYDRCAVVGRTEEGALTLRASRPEQVTEPFSHSIAERVLEQGEALLYDDILGQAPFDLGESIVGLNIHSVLCSPLTYKGRIDGLVYLDRSVPGAYDLEDLALLRSVCAQVAIALENARLYGELQGRFRQTAQELRVTQERLIESERTAALGRLVVAIAHEVRNPLTVIGGLSRRLERGGSLATDLHAATVIREETERLERVMGRVEALVSLPAAAVRPVALAATVEAALRELRTAPARPGRPAELCCGRELEPYPHDPGLTRTALITVLEHACDGPSGSSPITVGVVRRPAEIAIRIAPRGGGGGTGPSDAGPWLPDLALALAQRAMEAQGGEVRLGVPGGDFTAELVWPAACNA